MKKSLSVSLLASVLSVAAASAMSADATAWPAKTVQVIVPAGAGGDTDFNARTMAKYFEKITGKSMVITNMGGGGGTIATSQVKNAAPDGSTMLFGHTGQLIVNEVAGLADYGIDAFAISCIAGVDKGTVFVAGKKSGLKTVGDLVAKAKAQPGTVIYGTELGGYSHLQGLIFQNLAGVKLKIVDTGSASEKITSLLGGRIDLGAITFGAVKDYGTTGDMAVLAQFNGERNPLLGNIPTFKENGVNFVMEKPYIVAFPKGTDAAIVEKMASVMKQITEQPAYAKDLEQGFKQPVTYYGTKEALAHLQAVRTDFMQYKDLLRQKP
ncbi:tripartite tricarboxylate transporter substrate binding protein [Shumkonia mesophila]|uniref:tripartite tricarboxylate transporter substrate binding protein n=1 Tax=Shumkonia mesophila TaxID=2838854 RepID=UPI0029352CC5|nr:tripartite tricarboxylate transporter substrate binding protein [Shumkonia mesophila]